MMVHFYRGETHRSTSWRQRLDATTNWAVLTTATHAVVLTFANNLRGCACDPAALEPDHPGLPGHRGPALPLLRGLPSPREDAGGELPHPDHHPPARVADAAAGARWWRWIWTCPSTRPRCWRRWDFGCAATTCYIFGIMFGGWVRQALDPSLLRNLLGGVLQPNGGWADSRLGRGRAGLPVLRRPDLSHVGGRGTCTTATSPRTRSPVSSAISSTGSSRRVWKTGKCAGTPANCVWTGCGSTI